MRHGERLYERTVIPGPQSHRQVSAEHPSVGTHHPRPNQGPGSFPIQQVRPLPVNSTSSTPASVELPSSAPILARTLAPGLPPAAGCAVRYPQLPADPPVAAASSSPIGMSRYHGPFRAAASGDGGGCLPLPIIAAEAALAVVDAAIAATAFVQVRRFDLPCRVLLLCL